VAYRKDGERLFIRECSDRTRHNHFKLKECRFRLNIRKKFFTMRVVRHGNRLPREAVAALSPEVFKAKLDRALSNLEGLLEGVPAHGRGGGTRRSLRPFPNQTIP